MVPATRERLQVTLDTAVRALTIVLHWCPPMKRHTYMRDLEKNARLLSSKENITEGQVWFHRLRYNLITIETSLVSTGNSWNLQRNLARTPLLYPQACHSFIRSMMRKTIASVEFELDAGKHGATADTGTSGHARGVIQGRGGSGNEHAVMTEHDAPGNSRVVIDIDRVGLKYCEV